MGIQCCFPQGVIESLEQQMTSLPLGQTAQADARLIWNEIVPGVELVCQGQRFVRIIWELGCSRGAPG
jgi:hypothetical protein